MPVAQTALRPAASDGGGEVQGWSKMEVNLYRLLSRCEAKAARTPVQDIASDTKFHTFLAVLRSQLSALSGDNCLAEDLGKNHPTLIPADRLLSYRLRIDALANLLGGRLQPDLWEATGRLQEEVREGSSDDVTQKRKQLWDEPVLEDVRETSDGFVIVPATPIEGASSASAASAASAAAAGATGTAGAGGAGGAPLAGAQHRRGQQVGGLSQLSKDSGVRRRNRQSSRGPSSTIPGQSHRASIVPLSGAASSTDPLSLSGSARALLEQQRDIQDDLTEGMLGLAQQLKANTVAMGEKLKSSDKLIDGNMSAVEKNLAHATRARGRASSMVLQGWCTGCWTWLVMIALLFVFMAMILFMKIT